MNYCYIPNSVCMDSSVTPEEMITYALLSTYPYNSYNICLSYHILAANVFGIEDAKLLRKWNTIFKKGLDGLEARSLLIKKGNVCGSIYLYDLSKIAKKHDGNFLRVEYPTFLRMLRIKSPDNPKLTYYYIILCSTIMHEDPDTKKRLDCSKVPLTYLSKRTNFSYSTLKRYNKKLEDLGVISIIHYYDPAATRARNLYCYPKDEQYVKATHPLARLSSLNPYSTPL